MAGQGTFGGPSLPQYIFNWLEDRYRGLVNASNGAVPGITSQYLSVCHDMHIPPDVDVVIVEFSVNDGYKAVGFGQEQPFDEPRPAFERLVRKLLNYPNRPAVVLLHAYAWNQIVVMERPHAGCFYNNAERDYGEFERYYHLPSLSVKAACYHHMRNGAEGFLVQPRRSRRHVEENNGTRFYFDFIHPDERTGCRVMAELVMHLFNKVQRSLESRRLSPAERALAAAPVPAPMISGNYEAPSSRCFIGGRFTATVVGAHEGWEWINESQTERPKWGFVSNTPGSTIRLKVDTRAVQQAGGGTDKVSVQLSHLKSYENMGQADVTCEGCVCEQSTLDGHHDARTSLTFLHEFFATLAEECLVVVTVALTTRSRGHKVKLTGVVVSEVVGGRAVRPNELDALEFVGDSSMQTGGGAFVIKHA